MGKVTAVGDSKVRKARTKSGMPVALRVLGIDLRITHHQGLGEL